MESARQIPQSEGAGWGLLFVLLGVSAGAHVLGFLALPDTLAQQGLGKKPVEMTFYEPPPPPPPPKEEPPPEEKPKQPEPVKKLVVKAEPKTPPPPNEEAPPETPQKPVPIVVGVTLSSTTAAGGFAVQVGNTTYGKASSTVVDPSQVKAYRAAKYAPMGTADREPEVVSEVKIPYPPEAKKAEVEGDVVFTVTIDEEGFVENVSLVKGPGYGLDEAARDALKRYRFSPATRGGERVGYRFEFRYRFILD